MPLQRNKHKRKNEAEIESTPTPLLTPQILKTHTLTNTPTSGNNGNTHRAPHYPTQRVPGSLIKPVEELIEAISGEMVSWPVVEPAEIRLN